MTSRVIKREQLRQAQSTTTQQVCIHIPAEALRNPQGGLISITLVIDPVQQGHDQVRPEPATLTDQPPQLPLAPCYQLTPRELDVLKLVAIGLDNFDIARQLDISRNTVCNYVRILYEKLGVTSRTAAAIWARERGLMASGKHTTSSKEE